MTMDRWIGKTAIVTGASAGIGAEVAVALANAGMVVVATARRLEKLQGLEKKLKGRGKILPFRCDVSKEQDLVNLIEFTKKNTGGVDVLINNAAVLYKGTITDCDGKNATTKEIEESFQTNVVVVIIGTRLAVADMVARNVKGHVIILNSIAGHHIVSSNIDTSLPVYCATKHAVTQLAKNLRLEMSNCKTV